MTLTDTTIDLSDHDAFVHAVPYEWFRTLRREDPVHFNPEPDGPGFYAVTRYWDIREVHRNFAVYSSRSEEHTSELQSRQYLVCRLLLEKKKLTTDQHLKMN